MTDKKFQIPSRHQPIFRPVKSFLRLFFKHPRIISLSGELPDKCIIVANHAAKKGPMAQELYFPKFSVKWGAHQMLENYTTRKAYLRDVYYMQKCGRGKLFATLAASFEAIFSIFFYRGIKLIGTYPDARLAKTIDSSIKVLNADMAIMVFPKNSNNGYKDVMGEFFPGFVALGEHYYHQTGEDVPVYPVYYDLKKRIMVIGKPAYIQDYVNEGLDRYQIAQEYCKQVNDIYHEYIATAA